MTVKLASPLCRSSRVKSHRVTTRLSSLGTNAKSGEAELEEDAGGRVGRAAARDEVFQIVDGDLRVGEEVELDAADARLVEPSAAVDAQPV